MNVTHDGLTSAGQVTAPFPTGTVLGSDDGTFQVYVAPAGTPALALDAARDRFITPGGTVTVTGSVPAGIQDATATVTAAMPGFLLQQGPVPVQARTFRYTYNPVALNRDFPNLDVRDSARRPASVDLITLSFLVTGRDASGSPVASANTLYLREDELLSLSAGAAAAAGTTATVATNKIAYRTGDTLTVSVAVTNAGAARAVDGYVGVQLADGRTTLYFTGAGFVPTVAPLARAFPLASGATLGPLPVLSVTLPASIPAGSYTFFLTLTDPGNPAAIVASGSAAVTLQP